MSNLEKKQLKAQLTNEISKRFRDRIKELEDSRNALRTKIEIERQQYRELQEKYLNLAQEFESLKDWNTRLMEYMDMSPEDVKKYIVELKTEHMLNSIISKYLPFFNI
jgi:predicted nuclease with TOPRIM domain